MNFQQALIILGAASGVVTVLLGLYALKGIVVRIDATDALRQTKEIADAFKDSAEAKKAQIAELQQKLDEQATEFQRKLEEQAAAFTAKVDEQTREIAALREQVADYATLYGSDQLASRKHIASLEALLQGKDAHIADLDAQIAVLEARIAELEAKERATHRRRKPAAPAPAPIVTTTVTTTQQP